MSRREVKAYRVFGDAKLNAREKHEISREADRGDEREAHPEKVLCTRYEDDGSDDQKIIKRYEKLWLRVWVCEPASSSIVTVSSSSPPLSAVEWQQHFRWEQSDMRSVRTTAARLPRNARIAEMTIAAERQQSAGKRQMRLRH